MRVVKSLLLLSVVVVCGHSAPVGAADTDSAGVLKIANAYLEVAFDTASMSLTALSKASGLNVIERATLRENEGKVRRHDASHSIWGRGQRLEVQYGSGAVDRLTLYQGLPFIVFETILANTGTEDRIVDRIRPVRMTLDLDKPAAGLRAFGTAGLTEVDAKANPGSYSFLAVVDPASRAGLVAGWVSHDRGSGILFSDVKEGKAIVDARSDYGRLLIGPGQKVTSETLVIGYFKDARLGLEAYADAVARYYRIVLPPQPTVYCTWYHAGASNEKDILKNAQFAREHLVPFGFSVMQIDDKWQEGQKLEGPRKNFNSHRADGPYPSGMAQTARNLETLGLVPGIWFMPFAGTWDDPFYADKQDLFAIKDGKPYVVRWGGTCFDLTHPKTRDYVYTMSRRIAHDWGYKYFKLDGLWTGMATGMCYVNTGYKEDQLGETVLHDRRKTHVEAYRDGLELVHEAAGQEVFILGCNVAQNMRVLGASFGLVDAMRIGPDNGRNWSQICRGPFSGSNTYFLHDRVWYNDPDPIYMRDSMPLEHARVLCSWVALTGQLNASSIQYEDLSPERLHLLQRTMPTHGLRPRPVDLFEQKIPRIWLLSGGRGPLRRDVVGLFNWDEKNEAQIQCPVTRIGLRRGRRYVGFDYWANEFVEPFGRSLKATLPAATCRILAIRPVVMSPQVISTSRHISQGIVDIVAEKWDEAGNTLSGVSRVVGGDPYELRIAAQGRPSPWRVARVTIDGSPAAKIKLLDQEGWKVRVQIDTPTSQEVRWSVEFTPQKAGDDEGA